MSRMTNGELSEILNDAPLTDASKKSAVKILRFRKKLKTWSRIGVFFGVFSLLSALFSLTNLHVMKSDGILMVQLLLGPLFGLFILLASLHSLQLISAARAMEEMLLVIANQQIDPSRQSMAMQDDA